MILDFNIVDNELENSCFDFEVNWIKFSIFYWFLKVEQNLAFRLFWAICDVISGYKNGFINSFRMWDCWWETQESMVQVWS